MTNEDVLEEFRGAGALREGHFIMSSGLHTGTFLQKNLVFMHPDRCERLCRALAAAITERIGQVDLCVSPAVGGIIPGYETARHLGAPSIYLEREGGELKLRRAFQIPPGARVAVIEDVLSTGLSMRESVAAVTRLGGEVACCACIVDRSGGKAETGARLIALATLDVPAYSPSELPPELAAIPAEEPGSRRLGA